MAGEVQRWFDALPEHWQERAQRIRELMLDVPGMEEKWMFKSSPFYLHNGWLTFFWLKNDQLIIGFCAGARMLAGQALFAPTDHKVIRHYLPPRPPARLNENDLRRLIDEAVELNAAIADERAMKRKKKRR